MFDTEVIYAAVATIWAFITSGFVWVYKGRIADLRETILHERSENRQMVERLFAEHSRVVKSTLQVPTEISPTETKKKATR
jgi:hypothetical protein